jgi:hypothetical protein
VPIYEIMCSIIRFLFGVVVIQLMHCCFLNLLNVQLDINFIQSDIKNLGWRGICIPNPLPSLSVLLKQNLAIHSFIRKSGLNEMVDTYNSIEFQESKHITAVLQDATFKIWPFLFYANYVSINSFSFYW